MNERELAQKFRDAWKASSGESFSSVLARQSLVASAAVSPVLQAVLAELQERTQAELILHINGPRVEHHRADALRVAELIKGLADAVRETAKDALGTSKRRSRLLVHAPVAGSVKLHLTVERDDKPRPTEPLASTEAETVDSYALARVTQVLARSALEVADSRDSSVLGGLVDSLPLRSRAGIRRAATAIEAASWEIEGELERPGANTEPVRFSPASMARLLAVMKETVEVQEDQLIAGTIDGQRYSLAAMWFRPEVGAPFEAAVPQPELLARVAELGVDVENRVIARFAVTSRFARGDQSAPRRSFTLISIDALEPREALDI